MRITAPRRLCVSPFVVSLLFFLGTAVLVDSFAASNNGSRNGNGNGNGSTGDDDAFTLFDRFTPKCPSPITSIQRYDPSLVGNDHPSAVWVAVVRSANNKPSVFVKDDFLNAMRIATTIETDLTTLGDPPLMEGLETDSSVGEGILESVPVAVARLSPSFDFDGCWVLDTIRCTLKKEDTDTSCDGGSEHTEALGVAIDALLIHYLEAHPHRFDGVIRTKATLVSGTILEDRGFREVTTLAKDMATHTCSLDSCLSNYAERVVSTSAKGAGSRNRAIRICSLLGLIDREVDLEASAKLEEKLSAKQKKEDDEYDPFAGVKRFL